MLDLPPELDLSALRVCRSCAEVFGPFSWPGEIDAIQRCGCGRPHREDARWPNFDFNCVVELCRICASVGIRSGSRWSTFGCAECHPWSRDLMMRAGRWVIPIGRHSMHHAIGIQGADVDDAEIQRFADACTSLFEGMDRLEEWRSLRLAVNLDALGFDDSPTVLLTTYLAAAVRVDKAAARDELLRWWVATN